MRTWSSNGVTQTKGTRTHFAFWLNFHIMAITNKNNNGRCKLCKGFFMQTMGPSHQIHGKKFLLRSSYLDNRLPTRVPKM